MELDMEEVAITELEKLLSVPLDQVALKVLNMPEFSSLLAFLPWENRRKVAISMLKAVVSGGEDSKVKDVGEEEQLFAIIAPLLRDQGVAPPGMYDHAMEQGGSLISRTANLMGTLGISSSGDAMYTGGTIHSKGDPAKMAQFREEQTLVAKLVNVLEHEDTDTTYQMLNVARKYLQPGGAERVSVTMPALIFASLKLLRRVQQLEFPRSREEPADKAESADEDGAEETITAADSESADKSRPTEDKATEEAEADNNKSAEEKAEPAEDKSSTEVTEGENNIGDVDASAMKTDEGMNGGAAVKQNESANGSASNKDVKEELAPLFAKTVK
jgi:vacuolar protein sorting-associated protein 35